MGKTILNLDVWAGLGDNLQVSTIPRRFFEKYGYKGVYISNSNPYRNIEIKELIWDKNPYIAGFTDKKGINIVDNGLVKFDGVTPWIANMERIYGFEPPYTPRPEIYYDFKSEDVFNVKEKTIVDITCSNENDTMNKINYRQNIKKYFNKLNTKITLVRLNNIKTTKTFTDYTNEIISNNDYEFIDIDSIYDYCEIIKNCKDYICTFSGSHSLAAAIRDSFTCFVSEQYYKIKIFIYEGKINYVLI
jgi:hypothetical protein